MGRGYHATHCNCRHCGARFWAYPNRSGSRGILPKYCSRKCYNDSRAAPRKQPAQPKQEAKPAKPLRVSANWIYYAHQPPAESGNKASAALVDMVTDRDYVLIPADRPDLAVELVSCAELYAGSYGGDRDDRLRAMQAARVIKRATDWLRAIGK